MSSQLGECRHHSRRPEGLGRVSIARDNIRFGGWGDIAVYRNAGRLRRQHLDRCGLDQCQNRPALRQC